MGLAELAVLGNLILCDWMPTGVRHRLHSAFCLNKKTHSELKPSRSPIEAIFIMNLHGSKSVNSVCLYSEDAVVKNIFIRYYHKPKTSVAQREIIKTNRISWLHPIYVQTTLALWPFDTSNKQHLGLYHLKVTQKCLEFRKTLRHECTRGSLGHRVPGMSSLWVAIMGLLTAAHLFRKPMKPLWPTTRWPLQGCQVQK